MLSSKINIISINYLYTVMMIETKTLEKLRSIKNSNATKAEGSVIIPTLHNS